MKKSAKAIITVASVAAATAGAVAGFEAWSRARFGRSGLATVVEGAIRASGWRNNFLGRDPVKFENYIDQRRRENAEEYVFPRALPMRSLVFEETCDGMKTYHLGTTGKNERAVLYLHGGAYVKQISPVHWIFLDQLCQDTGAEIVVPILPLAPNHDYDEAYSLVTDLYEGMLNRYGADAITIMGDASGGGLAAGLAETFTRYDLAQPGRLVLISPQLDLTLRNPDISDYFDLDPMLAPWGMAQAGDLWADGDDTATPRLSPINGDVSGLRNVTLIVGTREILYPDCIKFSRKLNEAGVSCDLIIGQGQNHVWPLLPTPEGAAMRKRLATIVNTKV